MRDILIVLYFLIPLYAIGILALYETITPIEAEWMALVLIVFWYLKYYDEIKQLIKKTLL